MKTPSRHLVHLMIYILFGTVLEACMMIFENLSSGELAFASMTAQLAIFGGVKGAGFYCLFNWWRFFQTPQADSDD